jgi:hypothetical protein
MSGHEHLQSTGANSRALPARCVMAGLATAEMGYATILCAGCELVRKDSGSRDNRPLDARFVAPDFQEITG